MIKENYKIQAFFQDEYLINGVIRKWEGSYVDVFSPIFNNLEGKISFLHVGSHPNMNSETAMEALDAAEKAFDNGKGEWAIMKVVERIKCMQKFVIQMLENKSKVVDLLMFEIAKSKKDSEKEFDRTIDYINDTIEALKDLDRNSSRFLISHEIIAQIRRAPLGVTLCMGPYNYPLNETFTTLIPALIMGNTVILKPPKHGILLFAPLLKAFQTSFPKGVVNIIYGRGEELITPIMKSGRLNVLAFIGSSKVANILKSHHPKPNRLKCVLGLDAKNPAIILEDADIQQTVNECILGSLSFNGQRCTAIKIIFVHEKIAEKFIENFIFAVNKLKIGFPMEDDVFITAMPTIEKTEYLNKLIDDAEEKGAKVLNVRNCNGTLFSPVVLSNVSSEMRIFHEEQFGPVVPIVIYKNISEAMQYVVNSNYGQQASIFGNNSDEIAELVDTLVNQVCRVNINSQCQRGPDDFPFTGRKDSAEQTLSVSDALRVFSIRTLVAAKGNENNKNIINNIISEKKSKFLNTDFIL